MEWWIVVMAVSQFAFVAFIIAIAVNYRQKSLHRRSEERLRFLDRFGSGQELGEFLATERGRQFLGLFAVRAGNPSRIIISGIAIATILIFVGSSFLLLSALDAQDLGTEYLVAAILVLGVALGILAASMLSIRLARKLHLPPPEAPGLGDAEVD